MKQWISRILAAAMVVSLLSFSAFAADYTTIDPSNFNTTVGDTPTITQDGDTVTITSSYGVSIILEGVVSYEEAPSGRSDGTFSVFHLADEGGRVLLRNDSVEEFPLFVSSDVCWAVDYYNDDYGWIIENGGPPENEVDCPIGSTIEYETAIVAADPDDRSLANIDSTNTDGRYMTSFGILDGVLWNGALYVYFVRDNGRISLTDRTINGISFDEYYDSAVAAAEEPPAEETPAEPAEDVVVPSNQALSVNGEAVTGAQVYNINGSNYFKLRDVAAMLNGTGSQFALEYDAAAREIVLTTGEAYTPDGSELTAGEDQSATAVRSSQSLTIDGESASLTAYNIGGNNYFMLRDLGEALGFEVDYDAATRTMIINSK